MTTLSKTEFSPKKTSSRNCGSEFQALILRMSPRVNRLKPRPIRPASRTYQTSYPGITRFPSQPKGSAPSYLK
jgi:hypothetical protein